MATVGNIPPELNWVEKRGACTAMKVFQELVIGVENDIIAINRLRNLGEQSFKSDLLQGGTTIVVGQMNIPMRNRIKIGYSGNEIMAVDEHGQNIVGAYIGLNNAGRCVLRMEDGIELEQWQFRKIALERLFFGGTT